MESSNKITVEYIAQRLSDLESSAASFAESRVTVTETFGDVSAMLGALFDRVAALEKDNAVLNTFVINALEEIHLSLDQLRSDHLPNQTAFNAELAQVIGHADMLAPERFKSPPKQS